MIAEKVEAVADEDGNVTSGSIILAINKDESQAVINADKISLEGKQIDLTSENITIDSDNFSVDEEGNMNCNNASMAGANLTNGTIDITTELGNVTIGKTRTGLIEMLATLNNIDYSGVYNVGGLTYKINGNYACRVSASNGANGDFSGNGFITYNSNQQVVASIGNTYGSGVVNLYQRNGTSGQAELQIYNSSNNRVVLLGNGRSSDTGYLLLANSSGTTKISASADNGNITCVSLTQTSLEESKKNFEPLENALDIVKDIDIYKYNFIEEENVKKHIGFVIGDKFKYREEITSENNDGADVYGLASLCLQAIKEQQKQIEELKQEIKSLKGDDN